MTAIWRSLWEQPLHRKLGVAVALAVGVLLVARNGWVFDTPTTESGDFAANSILVDYAKSGRWFVGHYSRFGFYHPGPFFLYVQTLGELVFFDWLHLVPSAFNAQILALLVLNAALIGVATAVVGKNLGNAWLALWTPLFLVSLALVQPQALSLTWEPLFVILPFAFMIIVTASVLGGNPSQLPIAVFSFGMLFHAHAGFLFAAAVPFLILVGVLGWQIFRRGVVVPLRTWVWSGVVAAAFALPIVINTLIHWPGEFPKYLHAGDPEKAASRTPAQAVNFVANALNITSGLRAVLAVVVVAAIIWAVLVSPRKARPFLLWVLAFCGLATAVAICFSYLTIADLSLSTEVYLIWYCVSVPVLIAMVGVFAVLGLMERRKRLSGVLAAIGGIGAGAILLAAPGVASNYRGTPEVGVATVRIESQVPSDAPVVLTFDTKGWPLVAGVVEQLRRDGRRGCIANKKDPWKTLFTAGQVCTSDELKNGYQVTIKSSGDAAVPKGAVPIGDGLYLSIGPPAA